MHGAASPHAKRAGPKLVQGELRRRMFNLRLLLGRSFHFTWTGNEVDEDDQIAQTITQRFYYHAGSCCRRLKGNRVPEFGSAGSRCSRSPPIIL